MRQLGKFILQFGIKALLVFFLSVGLQSTHGEEHQQFIQIGIDQALSGGDLSGGFQPGSEPLMPDLAISAAAPTPVPEPSMIGFVSLGALALLASSRKSRTSKS